MSGRATASRYWPCLPWLLRRVVAGARNLTWQGDAPGPPRLRGPRKFRGSSALSHFQPGERTVAPTLALLSEKMQSHFDPVRRRLLMGIGLILASARLRANRGS